MRRFAINISPATHYRHAAPAFKRHAGSLRALLILAVLASSIAAFANSASTHRDAHAGFDLATDPAPFQEPGHDQSSGTVRILNVTFSDPGSDHLWQHGDNLDITVTVDRNTTINSASSVGTWSDALGGVFCNHGGTTRDQAGYRSGSGSTQLKFRCNITGPPTTRVVVPANSIDLRGVDPGYYINQHPEYIRTSPTHGLAGPTITGITITAPPNGPFWKANDNVDIHVSFSENVIVDNPSGGVPELTAARVIESRGGQADTFKYRSGSGTSTLVFRHRIHSKAGPVRAYEIPADRIRHNRGYIIAADDKALADLSHPEYKGATALAVPCGSNPNDLWCATLTVAKSAAGDNLGFENNSYGILSPDQFDHNGTSHELTKLSLNTTNDRLSLDIDPDNSASSLISNQTRLDMGSRVLWLPADEFTGTGKTIIWHNIQDLWDENDTVTIRLTRPRIPELSQWRPHVHGPPTIVDAVSDANWSSGDSVHVTLNFIRPVYVNTNDGTPTIRINLRGDGRRYRTAAYSSGSGTRDILFTHNVHAAGPFTRATVIPNSLRLNGGAIQGVESRTHAKTAHEGAGVNAIASSPSTENGQRTTAPTAHFLNAPPAHNGSPFKLELKFSGAPDGLTPGTHAAPALQVTNGSVTRATHKDKGSNPSWEITITPSGDDNVTVIAPNRSCDQANAICVGNRPLANAAAVTIEGPFQATFPTMPSEHDGSSRIVLHMTFDRQPRSGFSWKSIDGGVVTVSNGSISRVWRQVKGDNRSWGIWITPDSTADVEVRVNGTSDCAASHAVCDDYGRMLAAGDAITIQGPTLITVSDADAAEAEGATVDFPVTLNRTTDHAVAASYTTSNGTASAGADYTAASGTLTIPANQDAATISVAVLTDEDDESTETFTITLSNPSNAVIQNGTATGSITDTPASTQSDPQEDDPPTQEPEPPDLTGVASNAPTTHDGATNFTFHLDFSETPKDNFSYKTLTNHAFTVSNGTVKKARRLEPPGNIRWEITIAPSSASDTTVTLPSTTDCSAAGAICTNDGRMFTGPLTLTVTGPSGN